MADQEPPKEDTPFALSSMMVKKLEALRQNGGRVIRVAVQYGTDFAYVDEFGNVQWDDDHHG